VSTPLKCKAEAQVCRHRCGGWRLDKGPVTAPESRGWVICVGRVLVEAADVAVPSPFATSSGVLYTNDVSIVSRYPPPTNVCIGFRRQRWNHTGFETSKCSWTRNDDGHGREKTTDDDGDDDDDDDNSGVHDNDATLTLYISFEAIKIVSRTFFFFFFYNYFHPSRFVWSSLKRVVMIIIIIMIHREREEYSICV
jgi:hypothetical protein